MSPRPIHTPRLVLAAVLLGAVAGIAAATPSWAATPTVYAALGDSYASGVGAGPYDPASGSCDRSSRSADALWAAGHAGTTFSFVACSGATTDDVLANQLGVLSSATTQVTLTIGGNDAGFVTVVTTCLLGTDSACRFAVDTAKAYATTILPGKLDRTYAAVRSRAPHARLIVAGYPRLFELTPSCGLFGMDLAKRTVLDNAADTLAGVIAGRVAAAGGTFVDVRPAFAGHGICAGNPWIHSTTWPVTDSYHPFPAGYSSGYLPALLAVTG